MAKPQRSRPALALALQVFSLDFASGSDTFTVAGSVSAPERFNRLAWGQHVAADPAFPQARTSGRGRGGGGGGPRPRSYGTAACMPLPCERTAILPAMPPACPLQLGLLAGGLADGSVCLWDPAVVVDPKAKELHRTPLLAKMQKHTGAVRFQPAGFALGVCPHGCNLLVV